MDEQPAWLWIDFEGGALALELLLALLADSQLAGAEERPGGHGLRAYWPATCEPSTLLERAQVAAANAEAKLVGHGLQPSEDWLATWREGLRPFRASPRFWITPPGQSPPAEALEPDDQLLVIEQRRAFGTGLHPTTRLCLELLERELRPGETLLDVGTGTGVLAIAAVRLGARAATALDIDTEVEDELRSNLVRNQVSGLVEVWIGRLDDLPPRRYTHVVANLILERLLPLLPLLRERVGNGRLLLSGAEQDQRRQLLAALERLTIEPGELLERSGWLALSARRG